MGEDHRGELGQLVKRLREQAGMTQHAVEKATDGRVTSSHIANVEIGRVGLSEERSRLFCLAVGASDDDTAALRRLAGHNNGTERSPYDRLVELERLVGSLEARFTRFEAVFADLAAQVGRLPDTRPHDE